MMDPILTFFNSRSSGEQVALMIGAGIALHWAGVQFGEVLGILARS